MPEERRGGQTLDVLDQGRPSPDAGFEGARRDTHGEGDAPVDELNGRGLLPGYVGDGRAGDPDAGALCGGARSKGMEHRSGRRGVFAPDVENDLLGPDGARGQDGTVEDEVGPGLHQQTVLEAERLALGPVRDQRARALAPGHRPPLPSHREAGSASAPKVALIQRVDQLRAREQAGSESCQVMGGRLGSLAEVGTIQKGGEAHRSLPAIRRADLN